MKQKTRQKTKQISKQKYSLISNLLYIYKALFEESGKKMYFIFFLCCFLNLLTSSVAVMIPSVAVYLLENQKGIVEFLTAVCGCVLVYFLLQIIENWIEAKYSLEGTIVRVFPLNNRLIRKVLGMDYVDQESHQNQKMIGEADYAVGGNWVGVERMYKELPILLNNTLGLLLYGGAILMVDVRILIVLILMLAFNICTNKFARNFLKRTLETDTELNRKLRYLMEKSSNIICGKDARLYRMEQWFREKMEDYVHQGNEWQKKIEQHFYLPVASDTIFIALRDGMAYLILIRMAIQGEITIAAFTLLLGIVSNFSEWMFGMVNSWNRLLEANESVGGYRALQDWKYSFRHGEGVKADLGNPPEIILKDVSFAYPGEEKMLLSHLNLHIKRGEKIALVGSNGAGKTTLVKLLCGFYHPTEGKILVNGTSLEEYDIDSYFKMLGVVFQDINDLAFNLVQIVASCREEEADMERFWQAVRAAGLYEKIQSLEKKEHTYLGTVFDDNGIQLSGGQMQKLMLARCIYKNAPFLILDEPTVALDPIAESQMYEEYNNLTAEKTSIFISHRLASTRFCDRILFLENGQIAEEGTHEELMRLGGRYAKIYEIQSHYYKESDKESDKESSKEKVDMGAAYEI